MNIYLLKRSPYNEEFLLDSYAQNPQELIEIAEKYVREYFVMEDDILTSNVDMNTMTIIVTAPDDSEYTFYISKISPYGAE